MYYINSMMINKQGKNMKYQLLQIHLTDAEVHKVNTEGHNSVPKQTMKLDMSVGFGKKIAPIAKKALELGYYTHVANITADSLNGVFEVGNIGPEENIERLAPMHSVSVADIIVDEAGNKNVVASMGFEEVI